MSGSASNAAVAALNNTGNYAVKPPDALGTISGYAGLANTLAQNKLIQANTALTQQNTANAAIKNQSDTQSLALQRQAYISGRLGTLAYGGPAMQTPDNYNKVLDESAALGADPNTVNQFRQMITSTGGDPAKLQQLALRSHAALVPPQIAQGMYKPDTQFVNQGPQITAYNTPQPGQPGANVPVPAGTVIPTAMTPAERAQRVPGPPGVGGAQTTVPLGSVSPGDPSFAGVRPAAPAAQQPQPQAAAPAQSGAVPPAGIPGQITTSMPMGYEEAARTEAAQASQSAAALINTNNERPMRMAALNDMITQANTPGVVLGPDSDVVSKWRNRLTELGMSSPAGMGGQSAQEQLAKMMANFQTMQAKSTGTLATNEGLAQSIAATPHMAMSRQGLVAVAHQLQGSEDGQDVMARAWQAANLPSTDYAKWQAKFTAKNPDGAGYDLRAFWLPRMSNDERKQFMANTKDQDQLKKNYNYAVSQGWIQQ